jgi:predicted GNAT family acetyltransferase
MYADYIKEKTSDLIIETEKGFATYRYLEGFQKVYIIDIYVKPEFRKDHVASTIADSIVREAKKKGCYVLIGSVVPSNKHSSESVKVLLAYGMSLESSTNDFILFKKDI